MAPSRMTRARRSSRGRNPNAWMSRIGHTGELVTAAPTVIRPPRLPSASTPMASARRSLPPAAWTGSTHWCSLDALVFTGEIGWDQHEIANEICAGLALLGVTIPVSGNCEQDGPVSPDAAVPVPVVHTPRGMQPARDTTTALG